MGSNSSNTFSFLDEETFVSESKMAVDFIANYYKNIQKYPVLSQVKPGYLSDKLPDSAPYFPETMQNILNDVNDIILPGLTHWSSPSFFGFFPMNTSAAGFVGEMLCSGLNVVGLNWMSSPAATELETTMTDWLGKMLKLPSSFLFSGTGGGVMYGSTCEAILCTMVAARDKVLNQIGYNEITKLVVYASDQAHSTFHKGAKLVGIPPPNFRVLPTDLISQFSLSPSKLEDAIMNDIKAGLIPLYVCATIGSTTSNAIDPIKELGKVANKYGCWLHVDAAYAGSALICPEFRQYLNGVELADSFSMNPHKWFLVTMDCCCMWLKEPCSLTDSLTATPEYLRNNASEHGAVDYKDWQIALSRRFRAIKVWVVLRRYGITNLMEHIRSDVNMAKRFESIVESDNRFEIVAPRRFALVCFRLKPRKEYDDDDPDGNKLNSKLLSAINQSGRAFMTHGVINGIYMIRCAIGGTFTEDCHIDELWKLIQEKATSMILKEVK